MGVELCCRPYSAGIFLTLSDQIQNLQNCHTTPNNNDQERRHLGIGVFKVPSSMAGPLSYVLLESPFASVSTVSRGHPSLVSLVTLLHSYLLHVRTTEKTCDILMDKDDIHTR